MITYVPKEHNSRTDLPSKLTNTKGADYNRIVIQETLPDLSIEEE